MTAATARPRSAATERAAAVVARRRGPAEELGRSLEADVADADRLAARLRRGLEELADADYREGQRRVAPGIGPVLGVRWPLLAAVSRGFRPVARRTRPSLLLFAADRLMREDVLEPRWFAFGVLERVLADEPERAWQLLRRGAREAADWITVDTLARPYGRGILHEPYRWAELEQLVYSPSRWERRLVGSTIATAPHLDRRLGRDPVVTTRGLGLVGELIGDAEPEVQKALAWALRTLAALDRDAVTAFCEREADTAETNDDGHRAWVVRDALPKLEPAVAALLRDRLSRIRRRPGAPSTSRASTIAAGFTDLHLGGSPPEPPLA